MRYDRLAERRSGGKNRPGKVRTTPRSGDFCAARVARPPRASRHRSSLPRPGMPFIVTLKFGKIKEADLKKHLESELEKLPFTLGPIPLLSVTFLGGIFAAFTVNLPFMFGEEFGWRGYSQQPLQERFGVVPASLLIGVIWGFWHLPLWVMPGDGHSTYPFIAFLIMTTSISVV